jgi:hypothetical protein
MPLLRGLTALLFLGGIVYAMLSGNWGVGVITFSLGVVVLGLDRLRVAQSRPDRALGWVLVLCGVNHNVHRNQDSDRRNVGSFSAWCTMNV